MGAGLVGENQAGSVYLELNWSFIQYRSDVTAQKKTHIRQNVKKYCNIEPNELIVHQKIKKSKNWNVHCLKTIT
jgi:hypothetical protein